MSDVAVPPPGPTLEQTWRDRVRAWKASGLSVRAFCRREAVSEPSFYSWRRTIRDRDAAPAATPTGPAFVPLAVAPAAAPPPLDVVLRGGPTVRVPHGFDPAHLRAVVAVLEGRPC